MKSYFYPEFLTLYDITCQTPVNQSVIHVLQKIKECGIHLKKKEGVTKK